MVFHGFTKLFLSQVYRSYCDESFCEMQCPESHEVDTYACSFYLKQIPMSVYSHHLIGYWIPHSILLRLTFPKVYVFNDPPPPSVQVSGA